MPCIRSMHARSGATRGDFQVLAERGRPVLRVHLGDDVNAGLASLQGAMERASV
jgi:transaldolase/glucose-6-phosphate isomerase